MGQVSSKGPDLHSGVDGGAVAEPMIDMWVPYFGDLANILMYDITGFNSWGRSSTKKDMSLYLPSVSPV